MYHRSNCGRVRQHRGGGGRVEVGVEGTGAGDSVGGTQWQEWRRAVSTSSGTSVTSTVSTSILDHQGQEQGGLLLLPETEKDKEEILLFFSSFSSLIAHQRIIYFNMTIE
jgi:hypothetical protein